MAQSKQQSEKENACQDLHTDPQFPILMINPTALIDANALPITKRALASLLGASTRQLATFQRQFKRAWNFKLVISKQPKGRRLARSCLTKPTNPANADLLAWAKARGKRLRERCAA